MELQDSKPLGKFEIFTKKFKEFWRREEDNKTIKRYRFFYEEGINIINIYQQTKKTKVAYLTRERCWVDNRHLFSMLFKEFKEYESYLKGRKSL